MHIRSSIYLTIYLLHAALQTARHTLAYTQNQNIHAHIYVRLCACVCTSVGACVATTAGRVRVRELRAVRAADWRLPRMPTSLRALENGGWFVRGASWLD